jgi:hypothetical protein
MVSRAHTEKTFFGWRVVAAVFVFAIFGWGFGVQGPPVYLHAVREARGWSLSLVSMAVTTHFVISALVIPNLPNLYTRFGVAAVTKTGCVALVTGVIGWALAREPWQLFAATLVSGAGWAAMGAAAVNTIVATWFVRQRPAALATAYNGTSLGGVIFVPLWVAMIGFVGFPAAAFWLGLTAIVTVWFLADRYFAKTPEQMGLATDGDAPGGPVASVTSPNARPLPGRKLWRDWRFTTLATGMALGLAAQIGVLAHLFSLLVPALGAQWAGFAAGAVTASAVIGRIVFGWLMPLGADRRLFACGNYLVQLAGLFAFLFAAGENVPLLLIGVVLFGFGFGNANSLPPLIAQVEFVKEDVSRVVPMIVAIGQGTLAFAPAAFGLIREFAPPTGGAPGAAPYLFVAAAAIVGVAILSLLAGRSTVEQT